MLGSYLGGFLDFALPCVFLTCQHSYIVYGDAVFVIFDMFTNRCKITNLFAMIIDTCLQLPDCLSYVVV